MPARWRRNATPIRGSALSARYRAGSSGGFFIDAGVHRWTTVALYTMGGGIVGALLAAVPGLIDLLSLPPGPRRTALTHMAINLTVVVIYVINFWMRLGSPERPGKLIWLSVISIGLLVISGWLGGKMVYVHGIAVDTPPGPTRR